MSIYDVPVADTKFFPVSGDMMRQMTTDQKNDTGDSAKNPSDAVYSITPKGKQAMLLTSSVPHTDLQPHPFWCRPDECLPADHAGDRTLHQRQIGYADAHDGKGLDISLVKFDGQAPTMIVGESDMNLRDLDDLIRQLNRARLWLIATKED